MEEPYFKSEDATLYLGDCSKILENIPTDSLCAIITDPPYGIKYKTKYALNGTFAPWLKKPISGDETLEIRDFVIGWAKSRALPWSCFGSWKACPPEGARGALVWNKGPETGMGDLSFPWKNSWETIFIGGQGWEGHRDEGVISGHFIPTRVSMGRTHPTEKPVSLISMLIKKLPIIRTIIDPFCGTGSTGVAAIKEGRNFIGIEIDRDYIKVAKQRIEDKRPLFK